MWRQTAKSFFHYYNWPAEASTLHQVAPDKTIVTNPHFKVWSPPSIYRLILSQTLALTLALTHLLCPSGFIYSFIWFGQLTTDAGWEFSSFFSVSRWSFQPLVTDLAHMIFSLRPFGFFVTFCCRWTLSDPVVISEKSRRSGVKTRMLLLKISFFSRVVTSDARGIGRLVAESSHQLCRETVSFGWTCIAKLRHLMAVTWCDVDDFKDGCRSGAQRTLSCLKWGDFIFGCVGDNSTIVPDATSLLAFLVNIWTKVDKIYIEVWSNCRFMP